MTFFPKTDYWQQYQARASGILHWPKLDALWAHLGNANENWYVYDLTLPPPDSVLSAGDFTAFLTDGQTLVNTRRDQSHSGAVYVDNLDSPTFIKIFDPQNMGVLCGGDHEPTLPRYILSKIKPDAKPVAPPVKKGIFSRLTNR